MFFIDEVLESFELTKYSEILSMIILLNGWFFTKPAVAIFTYTGEHRLFHQQSELSAYRIELRAPLTRSAGLPLFYSNEGKEVLREDLQLHEPVQVEEI